jgi:hypothetical protein
LLFACPLLPTGLWSMLKIFTVMAMIAAMKGHDRNGLFSPKTKCNLIGGSESTLGLGHSSGEDCVKYVGGPVSQ